MATYYYVDLSVASDGGSGTIGSPWTRADGAVIQYALNNITQNTTSGDVLVISGTAHTTTTYALTLATYGTPGNANPLWFLAGTSPTLTAATPVNLFTTGYNSVHIQGLTNDGVRINVGGTASVMGCTLNNISAGNGINVVANSHVCGCIVNMSGTGAGIALTSTAGIATENIVVLANGSSGYGIRLTGNGSKAIGNIIKGGTGSYIGMSLESQPGIQVSNNSLYSAGGTGTGISATGTSSHQGLTISKNLVEGWSGTGGVGISTGSGPRVAVFANSVYNCATATSLSAETWNLMSLANETLGASPFTNAASDDFSPVDVGSVYSGYSNIGHDVLAFRGAIAPPASGGGAGGYSRRMIGGGSLV